ncbi:hypothetical protein BDF14DRAFT_422927 [Spinellus fusiger]|nr:hypothetical protein BDF14DRAFT_422927 [Spinellus fusiger]
MQRRSDVDIRRTLSMFLFFFSFSLPKTLCTLFFLSTKKVPCYPNENNTELGQLKSMVEFYGRWLLTVTRITDGVALDPTPETDSLSEGASVGSGSSEGPVDTPSIHSSDSPHVYYDHPQPVLCCRDSYQQCMGSRRRHRGRRFYVILSHCTE